MTCFGFPVNFKVFQQYLTENSKNARFILPIDSQERRLEKHKCKKTGCLIASMFVVGALGACSGVNAPKLPAIPGFSGTSNASKSSPDSLPQQSDTQTARAVQVGWTSARARKCNFYFDDAKLKAGLLSYETKLDPDPVKLQKISQTYDYTRDTIAKRIAAGENYCDPVKIGQIRKDLNRHLAGDYTPASTQKAEIKKEAEILTGIGKKEKWNTDNVLWGDNKPVQ